MIPTFNDSTLKQMALTIKTINAFSDNYIWLMHQAIGSDAYVVDPGEAEPVIKALEKYNLNLQGVLVTHQHPDHIGGIPQLLELNPNLTIYGPDDIELVTHPVTDQQNFTVLEIQFTTIAVPGHTLNHLAFYSQQDNTPIAFCGDTLFAGGCGRIFEGTAEQMLNSLKKLSKLPAETLIYCAHEYTQSNLAFATAVEPDNKALKLRVKEVNELRKKDRPSVPSRLSVEFDTNPFLRSHIQTLKVRMEKHLHQTLNSEVDVFANVRKWKDNF